MKPVAFVLEFPGSNCHHESANAFHKAGAEPRIVLLSELRSGRCKLTEADLICFPGGFSFGDHFGAGRVAAFELVQNPLLRDQLEAVRERRTPMIGICNGFQILVAAGLLPGDGPIGQPTTLLDLNLSARFEYWSEVEVVLHAPTNSLWTTGLDGLTIKLPVAHGEGRLVGSQTGQIIATYGSYQGEADYPISPNGSAIAGVCSDDGSVAGFMPHPERRTNDLHGGSQGLQIFRNGVKAVK
jgi:phosphoribosylformylglycinamidine synthase I